MTEIEIVGDTGFDCNLADRLMAKTRVFALVEGAHREHDTNNDVSVSCPVCKTCSFTAACLWRGTLHSEVMGETSCKPYKVNVKTLHKGIVRRSLELSTADHTRIHTCTQAKEATISHNHFSLNFAMNALIQYTNATKPYKYIIPTKHLPQLIPVK